jgi:transcriptional regulator with XRE-family HTH domain
VSALPDLPVPTVHPTSLGGAPVGDGSRRRELAGFLRSRRERLRPQDVGLPPTGRRRTPGLRREEVAAVAGVGVTWYTWLEQARNVTPSPQVLDAVARALRLDEHERAHLFVLAGTAPGRAAEPLPVVSPQVTELLRQVEPLPAVITNARYDILAYNRVYRFAVLDLDEVPADRRNTLRLLLTDPAWIASAVDRDRTLARLVSQFRAGFAEHVDEPAWQCLVQRLLGESEEFRRLWERHDVEYPQPSVKTVLSPRAGLLRLTITHLWLDRHLSRRMSVYTPVDEPTRDRLARFAREVCAPEPSTQSRSAGTAWCAEPSGPAGASPSPGSG